jgi:hypothetical protein
MATDTLTLVLSTHGIPIRVARAVIDRAIPPRRLRPSSRRGAVGHDVAIVASQVAWLGRKAAELLAAYRPPAQPAGRTPGNLLGALTFGETERLWREEVAPLLPQFTSMNRRPGQERVDPASPWAPHEVSDAYLMHDG